MKTISNVSQVYKYFIVLLCIVFFTVPAFSQVSKPGKSSRLYNKGVSKGEVEAAMKEFTEINELNMDIMSCNKPGETFPHTSDDLEEEYSIEFEQDQTLGGCNFDIHFIYEGNPPIVGELRNLLGCFYNCCLWLVADEIEYRFPVETRESSSQLFDSRLREKAMGLGGATGGGGDDEGLTNDPSFIEDYSDQVIGRLSQDMKLNVELANQGLEELGLDTIKDPELSDASLELAQKALDQWKERDLEDRYNAPVSSSAWPRSTYETINLESTDNFDGTCHVPFKDVFSSDGAQVTYFLNPLITLTETLMDLPEVALESARNIVCDGTSCGGDSASDSGAGIFRCFKNNKALGMTPDAMASSIVDYLNANGHDVDGSSLDLLQQLEMFPSLAAQQEKRDKVGIGAVTIGPAKEASPRVCIDFAGFRLPWNSVTYGSKFFGSYRHLAALQQGLDASSYFQAQSGDDAEGSTDASAALPIGHAISTNDRFLGLQGKFALEVAPQNGMTCPNISEMTEMMESSPAGALALGQANELDVEKSEYQAFTRYPVFKCGGGSYFRGTTLLVDFSKTLCQTDSNAEPYDGDIFPFWEIELPRMITLTPPMTTKVC